MGKSFLLSFVVSTLLLVTTKEAMAEYDANYSDLYDSYDYNYGNYDNDNYGDENGNYYDEFADYESSAKIADPLEPVNRVVFKFNDKLDIYVARPVTKWYRKIVPSLARKGIRNFLGNLTMPVTFANSVLQGDIVNASKSVTSFAVNSTIGIGGLIDITGSRGFTVNDESFTQTLGKYGVGQGIYLVLPVLGSSSVRSVSGLAVDTAVDPFSYNVFEVGGKREIISNGVKAGKYTMELVDKREKYFDVIDNVRKNSFDPYSTARSAFVQNSEFEVNNGNINKKDTKKNKEKKGD